ncbi:hypothetical protein [Rubrivirga sp.]|uniref:hypothetical protein n=1 Tax=Rubrivirga sp. TaxID=1885344 RepID=UPI003B51592A
MPLAFQACLPSSQKENSRAISAADSASVALAETVLIDTLAEVWTARAPQADPMPVPMTLAWVGDTLAVVETQEPSVRRFSTGGGYVDRTDLPAESYPYGAGVRGDTVVVLARGRGALLWVVPGQGVVREVPAPAGATAAVAAPGLLAVRVGGGPDTLAPAVVRLDERGAEVGRRALAGPAWRSVGFLRVWEGDLAALSGYRPVVDRVGLEGAGLGRADTLALVGFSSPQLPRSAQFMRQEVDEPPLLMSSADVLGGRLFVLNLRSDHVRVDVYDRDGRLQRVLVSPTRGLETDVALDLAVRRSGGAVELAVLMSRPPGVLQTPESRVVLYRWRDR